MSHYGQLDPPEDMGGGFDSCEHETPFSKTCNDCEDEMNATEERELQLARVEYLRAKIIALQAEMAFALATVSDFPDRRALAERLAEESRHTSQKATAAWLVLNDKDAA